MAARFELGRPWILDAEKLEKPYPYSHRLHDYYLRESKKSVKLRETSIKVTFEDDHFHHELLDRQFFVDFQDLWDLYNYRSLGVSVLACYAL